MGVELQGVVQHGAAVVARKVEIGVVGEVDNGVSVGGGSEVELELAGVGPFIFGRGGEVAGVSFFAVLGVIGELHVAFGGDFHVPDLVLEAFGAAMEGVGAVVDGEFIVFAVEHEVAAVNAVGHTSGHLAGAGTVVIIVGHVGIAEHHVVHLAVAVRHFDAHDAST